MRKFQELASFSDLSYNMVKCKTAVIRILKRVKTAVYSMTNIDPRKTSVKTTKISFSYNVAIQNELNFRTTISKIQTVLELWGMQRLSLERKLIIFK